MKLDEKDVAILSEMFANYEWQSEEDLSYVNNLDDGALLNFSDLARTFGLKDNDAYGKDNKNQVVKQFLVNNGININ